MHIKIALQIAKQLLTTEDGRKLLKWIVITVIAIVLLIGAAFLPISGFVTGDDNEDIDALLDDTFVITQTRYYKAIEQSREAYIEQTVQTMSKIAQDAREEYKYEIEVEEYDANTDSYSSSTETVYPTVEVITPSPPIVTAIAYFCFTEEVQLSDVKDKVSKQSVIDFYENKIANLPYVVTSHNQDYYTVSLTYKTDDELSEALLTDGTFKDEGDVDFFITSIERITELIRESGGMGYDGTPSGNISDSSVAKQIWDYFKSKGWSDYACAALIGNIEAECGMKVVQQEAGGTGIGMAQWSYGRRTKFLNWLDVKGYNLSNVEAQCEYLIIENVWYKGNVTLYNSGGLKHQSKASSLSEFGTYSYSQLSDAVDDFLWHWESPNYKYAQWDRRQGAAQDAYNLFATGGSSPVYNGTYAQIKASFFPNGKLPTSESQMGSYLTTISFVNSAGNTKKVRVHKAVSADLLGALTTISAGGYEIKQIDGYVWKNKTNSSSGSRSSHSYGLAIDKNYSYGNPQVIGGVVKVGTPYGSHELSMYEGGIAVTTMKSSGWKWGGNWTSSKDYMHFSVSGD
ncbi:D-alanyl-D-alanine carboxypeptidase [Lacrimispora sphenoides]|uniref:phage tail tip lysozyme n=1 Tax=Lacrimispora sphenoides TaxID=29370 RepID=UPI0008BEEE64|nr:phage tail tip lysozyme [Lacrimispora sphenoides]SEU22244.1 D-alanyl-D-alanine carboxypeptidase [Lacrimispora sphenoides]